MPWPQNQIDVTRLKILESAARLFAFRGYSDVSIDEVMEDAGLTRGAFYRHFRTKTDVYHEAILHAFTMAREEATFESVEGLAGFVDGYLQRSHTTGESLRCPLVFMAFDISRREPAVRAIYTTALKSLVSRMEDKLPERRGQNRHAALQMAVTMVGGAVLARAVDDPDLAEELLAACRADCHELLEVPCEATPCQAASDTSLFDR